MIQSLCFMGRNPCMLIKTCKSTIVITSELPSPAILMTFPLQRSGNGKRVIDKSVVFNCKLYRRHRKHTRPPIKISSLHFSCIYIPDYTLIKYLYLNIVPVICMDIYGCSLLTNLAKVSFCILEIIFYLW